MTTQLHPKIKTIEVDGLDEARRRAEGASGAIGGITIPVSIFRQGGRWMLAGALPVPFVVANLVSDHVSRNASLAEVQARHNRPIFEEHVSEIKNYLLDNLEGHFILPPLTLNIRDELLLYTFKEDEEILRQAKAGFLVISRDTQIDIADGQHRKGGLKAAYEQLSGDKRKLLANTSLAVMLTTETDPVKIHQDFADCSKTKPINPSQLAVYDRRNPTNALVLGLAEKCALFKDKLDTTSSKLGKSSPFPFITNQVRQVVKVFLTGSNAEADEVFEGKAKKFLGGDGMSATVDRYVQEFTTYLNRATQAIPEYREIALSPPGEELRAKLTKWRNEGYVSLTGTGLIAITRVLYELMKAKEVEWATYVDRMGSIDWRRGGATEWSQRVVTPDKAKVNTGYAASMAAAADIKRLIGFGQAYAETQELELQPG